MKKAQVRLSKGSVLTKTKAAGLCLSLCFWLVNQPSIAQVGIGTELPKEKLHVHDGSLLSLTPDLDPVNNPFYDPSNSDDDPVQYFMKWINERGAFRSGAQGINSNALNPANVGKFSFASGYEANASGLGASAVGLRNSASGIASFASGQFASATGNVSFAHGSFVAANGHGCVAMGSQVSSNLQTGSFIFGDGSGSPAQNTGNNQMMMRFIGGYQLFTNSGLTAGVRLLPGGNAWVLLSDVNKKENFAPVNGEDVLNKIGRMSLTTWNYKGQDPKEYRHYGPMAQDFFAAFGKDAYGTIGNDTTINQADFDGVNLIAIQALVKRTEQLERQNHSLQEQLMKLQMQVAGAERRIRTRNRREAVVSR